MNNYIAECKIKRKGLYQELCEILVDDIAPNSNLKIRYRLMLHNMLFRIIGDERKKEYYATLVGLHPAREVDIKYLLETVEKGFIYRNDGSIAVRASSPNKARALIRNNRKALEECFGVIASLPNGAKKEKRVNGRTPFKKSYSHKRRPL